MLQIKRGNAITGALFTVAHPSLPLTAPFTSHVDIAHGGLTHQVLTTVDRSGFNYANTTGEFSVAGLDGHIIESIDTVETQATHRYQAVVSSEHGALSTQSYVAASAAVELVGALRPSDTALGIIIEPDDSVEIVGSPKVAMTTEIGVLEFAPLTPDITLGLPDWTGTAVTHGELFAGHHHDDAPWLTLVCDTARAITMIGADVDPDHAAQVMADLQVTFAL